MITVSYNDVEAVPVDTIDWDTMDYGIRGIFMVYDDVTGKLTKTYNAFCIRQVLNRVLQVEQEKDNKHNWIKDINDPRLRYNY
jgi:hypothetical protein